MYLIETGSLVWFAVRNGKYNLTDRECTKVLALLQEEATDACKSQNNALYPPDKQNQLCDNK